MRATKPGKLVGIFIARLRPVPLLRRVLPRARRPARATFARITHVCTWARAVRADDPRRALSACSPPRAAASASSRSPGATPSPELASPVGALITLGGPIPLAQYMAPPTPLLCDARPARRRRRLHHRARDQPDVRRADRAVVADLWDRAGRPARRPMSSSARAAARSPPMRCARWRKAGLAAGGPLRRDQPACCARRRPSASPARPGTTPSTRCPTDRPLLIVANEFFDALPIRQLVRIDAGWRERMVDWQGERLVLPIARRAALRRGHPRAAGATRRSAAMVETSPGERRHPARARGADRGTGRRAAGDRLWL